MTYHKRRISKRDFAAAMALIPTKEYVQQNIAAPQTSRNEDVVTQPTLIPTNPLPENPRSLAAIKKEVQEESGFIPFLTPEARQFWAKTREVFYIIDAKFDPDGKYGESWVLTFSPLEGPLAKMAFVNSREGSTRDEMIARIAENLPVGPCVLTQTELANGNTFWNLESA